MKSLSPRKIFPKSKIRPPSGFVRIKNKILISIVNSDTVVLIENRDLDKLLSLIPWDGKLDPIRKLIHKSNE